MSPKPTLSAEDERRIVLYERRAAELLASPVARGLRGLVLAAPAGVAPLWAGRASPSETEFKAFILDLRPFIQSGARGDRISFGELAGMYAGPTIPPDLARHFREARDRFNTTLDAEAGFMVYGRSPSNREMLGLFLNGRYAHANPAKAEEFDRWTALPTMRAIIEIRLFDLLGFICGGIGYVGAINRELAAAAN